MIIVDKEDICLTVMEKESILFPDLSLKKTSRFSVVSADVSEHYRNLIKMGTLPGKRKLVHLDLNCDYTRSVVVNALHRRHAWCEIVDSSIVDTLNADEDGKDQASPSTAAGVLQIGDFENLRWEMVMRGHRHRASSYLVRKGLSRKAQLALQIKRYTAKHADSVLRRAVPFTCIIDTWGAFEEIRMDFGGGTFANFDTNTLQTDFRTRLSWCLDDLQDTVATRSEQGWRWILKPSVTNKGSNISLCDGWETLLDALEEQPDIREWVLQRYVEQPLLVVGHKFHLRVYILCVGALKVFVFDQILVLLAAHPYEAADTADIYKHLTNTARSAEDINFSEEKFVKVLDDLPFYLEREYPRLLEGKTYAQLLAHIRSQVHDITGNLFTAFENEYTVFAPMPNCFELYGLDFMVDESLDVHLLEVNPGPDFKQTGGRLKGLIEALWENTLIVVVDGTEERVEAGRKSGSSAGFSKVYDKEASISGLSGGMSLK